MSMNTNRDQEHTDARSNEQSRTSLVNPVTLSVNEAISLYRFITSARGRLGHEESSHAFLDDLTVIETLMKDR